jgi:hypothetical protein
MNCGLGVGCLFLLHISRGEIGLHSKQLQTYTNIYSPTLSKKTNIFSIEGSLSKRDSLEGQSREIVNLNKFLRLALSLGWDLAAFSFGRSQQIIG